MTVLLDANVLIAPVVADHVHHQAAEAWFADATHRFATCPTAQGRLLRLLIREGRSAATALAVVSALAGSPRHEFWPDGALVESSDVQVWRSTRPSWARTAGDPPAKASSMRTA